MNHSISYSDGQFIRPKYFSNADLPWILPLVEIFESNIYKPKKSLRISLFERKNKHWIGPRFDLFFSVMEGQFASKIQKAKYSAREIRELVFNKAENIRSESPENENILDCQSIFRKIGSQLGLSGKTVDHLLYSDIPDEQIIYQPEKTFTIELSIQQANLLLTQKLIGSSELLTIKIIGNSLNLIRVAKWNGLLCTVSPLKGENMTEVFSQSGGALIEMIGPLSLVRKTKLYQNRLKSILPKLIVSRKFELMAKIKTPEHSGVLRINQNDPLHSVTEQKKFDSGIEEKFHRQFLAATDDWDLIREPAPLASQKKFVYPDFLIRYRTAPEIYFYLEIMGFWTNAYIKNKIFSYNEIKETNIILCVKESLKCHGFNSTLAEKIIKFKTRVDVREVLKVIEGSIFSK